MPGKCTFQQRWLRCSEYNWVAPDTANENRAKCKVCAKDIDLTSMGESALKSHMKSTKHVRNLESISGNAVLEEFSSASPGASSSGNRKQSGSVDGACKMHELVMDAEILWTLKVITSHYSCSSTADASNLFRKMFPDSEIAKKFSVGETKCAYIACHGLRPYLLSCLQKEVRSSEKYVVMFDESLNESAQQKQMDIHIRCWNDSHQVCTRYFTSVFMGHSTADDMEEKIVESLSSCLSLSKVIQVSMDGPSVNWSFFRKFQKHLESRFQVKCLDIGSCGLHTVHNALKAGIKASNWGIDSFLSSLSYLFHNSPARREDYAEVTGKDIFPLNFVPCRWVENVPVLERAVEIWNVVGSYIEAAENKAVTLPKCTSFENLQHFRQDPLLLAKLHFTLNIALVFQPFLVEYQSDKPMVFFLARDLEALLRTLLSKFIKSAVVAAAAASPTNLLNIDFREVKNHLPVERIDVGHAVVQFLRDCKCSPKDIFVFRMECKKFLINVTAKVIEKSPIKYALVRGLSALDPRVMLLRPDKCENRLKIVLGALIDSHLLAESKRDIVVTQYQEFLLEKKDLLLSFEKPKHRLDDFFRSSLNTACFTALWDVVQKLLLLSHGQAAVERGFSVNRQVAVENLKDVSYISKRMICDAVVKYGGIFKVPINRDMRVAVASAHRRYVEYLEKQKKDAQTSATLSKRKLVVEELDALRAKKAKLEKVIDSLSESADSYAEKAEVSQDFSLIVKSNSLRKTAKAKANEIFQLEKEIKSKLDDLALSGENFAQPAFQ